MHRFLELDVDVSPLYPIPKLWSIASQTSWWSSIQCKLKDNPLCYYLHHTILIPTPAHPQPIHNHLNLHLCIPNCQSKSNSWNILDVTIYGCRSDNISRPLWRTGTLQCALNNINSWKKRGGPALAEDLASQMERKRAQRGDPMFWVGGVIETMCSSPSGGIRGETEPPSLNITFN